MKIAVVYHSGYGHTAEQAKAVVRGVQAGGAEALLIPVGEVDKHWGDLEQSAAIIFGTPTYMGSISADFKKFMDASSKSGWEENGKTSWPRDLPIRGARAATS